MKRTELITVEKLIKELKRFEKTHADANVTCRLPDDTLCYAVNVRMDKDGDVCIRFEEDEEDSGCYEMEMLLSELERYDSGAKVYLEACGLYMTFIVPSNGKFFDYDGGEDCICCDGKTIGEYEEQEYCSGWHTPAERRMLAEMARKEKRQGQIEYGVLLALTILIVCGFFYNVWAAVTLSGDALWKNILWAVACLFCALIGSLVLYFEKHK